MLQRLKGLGVRTHSTNSGGAWTSTERTASPVPPARRPGPMLCGRALSWRERGKYVVPGHLPPTTVQF